MSYTFRYTNVTMMLNPTFLLFPENVMSKIQDIITNTGRRTSAKQDIMMNTGRRISGGQSTRFPPYRVIHWLSRYFDSYNVVLPVSTSGCSLQFATNQYPYVENYYIIFE
jgi:hypothetical protein